MRRIPNFVIRRNRNNAEAERNAQYYARPVAKVCACGHDEDDHLWGGRCEKSNSTNTGLCPCQHFQEDKPHAA